MHWFGNWFVKITGWILHVFVYKKKIYYEDKKVQSRKIKGRAIIVSNHTSVWDYPLMMYVFCGRTLRCQIAELMFEKNIFLTFVLKWIGAIRVDRKGHDFSFMVKSEKILSKNGVVLVYPESKIPKEGEERPLPFKPSVVYTALNTDTKIIPVFTNGSYFSKQRTRVIIGKPLDLKDFYDDSLDESTNLDVISKKLRNEIIRLGNELNEKIKN